MYQIERQEKILEYINEKKRVRISELCELFNVSVVTIRNDLYELAEKNLIVKTHGGAISVEDRLNLEIPCVTKYKKNYEAKRKIAQIAVSLINDKDVIILDSGSTTLEIAKEIGNKNVTVITNDMQIGLILAANKNVTLIMTGGTAMKSVYTLIGEETKNFLERIVVNKCFLGCDAFHVEYGITNRTLEEVAVKKAMMKSSKKIIVCSDSSKFGQKVFAKICDTSDIDILITEKISKKDLEYLNNLNVKVLLPNQPENEKQVIK